MEKYIIEVINRIAIFIFSLLSFIGFVGLIDNTKYSSIDKSTILYICFFIVGSFGLIVLLTIYNLRLMKK